MDKPMSNYIVFIPYIGLFERNLAYDFGASSPLSLHYVEINNIRYCGYAFAHKVGFDNFISIVRDLNCSILISEKN